MIAINKHTKARFVVVGVRDTSFSGRVIIDPTETWSRGQLCKRLKKDDFVLQINWHHYETIIGNIKQLGNSLDDLKKILS